jgi:hypothetical protein
VGTWIEGSAGRTSIERFIRERAFTAPGLAALRMKSASHETVASSSAIPGANDSARNWRASSLVPHSRSRSSENAVKSASRSSFGMLNG